MLNNLNDKLFAEIISEHIKLLSKANDFDFAYYNNHTARYRKIFDLIPKGENNSIAIEFGATSLFQPLLKTHFNYPRVIGTIFSSNILEKKYYKEYFLQNKTTTSEILSLDLESDLFPLEDSTVDFILCSEVIEHLDVDPMFMLAESNRILKPGGKILITTPNSCSARNFWKIANGYRPHFFMQYEMSRSPYRHNIEWDIHGLAIMLTSAGYRILNTITEDVFEKKCTDGIDLLRKNNLPLENRGDCIFLIAEKVSPVVERFPQEIYV